MTGPTSPRVLVAIPAYGSAELTDTVLADLLWDDPDLLPDTRIVVVDNAGDYELPPSALATQHQPTVYRAGANLRWIGSANGALQSAMDEGFDVCAVLNNDTRLSPGFLAGLVAPFAERPDAAIVAACYDDFWLHQRASVIPETAAAYVPQPTVREVPFCDGTAIAFSVPAIAEIGLLDTVAFPRHGYGSDIDLALRARAAGYVCLVTEGAYVSHLRRATMNRLGETSEANRIEILNGMDSLWGEDWRAQVGLSPDSFPPHNTGSGASWYL